MAYEAKTNWKLDDTVMPDDMNRIEQGIADMDIDIENVSKTVSVIEPSDTNIVDLNSFTNTGIYIIKNATSATLLNDPFGSTRPFDLYLIVTSYTSTTNVVLQRVLNPMTTSVYYGRTYTNLAWAEWRATYNNSPVTMPTTGWSESAPYTITLDTFSVRANDTDVVAIPQWSSDLTTRQAEQEAWNLVSMITTNDKSITITCDEGTPQTAVLFRLILNR